MQSMSNALSKKNWAHLVELMNKQPAAAIDPHAQVKVPRADRPATSTDARRAASELNDRIGAWVNEGGAGDEAKR